MAQSHTPNDHCVRFANGRHLPRRNTRYRAGATPFPDRTFTGWTAPASPGAPLLRHHVGLALTTRCRSPGALRKILYVIRHQTVLNEFYRVAFHKKVYRSIDELQADLDIPGSRNTMRCDHIRGADVLAKHRCRPSLMRHLWQRRK